MERVAHGTRAVVPGARPAGVAAAPDVGTGADLVGRRDRRLDRGRRRFRRRGDAEDEFGRGHRQAAAKAGFRVDRAFEQARGRSFRSVAIRRLSTVIPTGVSPPPDASAVGREDDREDHPDRQHQTRFPTHPVGQQQNRSPLSAYGVSCRAGAEGAALPPSSGGFAPNFGSPAPRIFGPRIRLTGTRWRGSVATEVASVGRKFPALCGRPQKRLVRRVAVPGQRAQSAPEEAGIDAGGELAVALGLTRAARREA